MSERYCVDYHTHSNFSADGDRFPDYSIEKMCEKACEIGLSEIAITDHYDTNPVPEGIDFYPSDLFAVEEEIKKQREKFKGRLRIVYGVELGQPTQAEDVALNVLSSHEFDFVIGSLHNNSGEMDFCFIDYAHANKNRLISLWDTYLNETIDHIRWGRGRFHTLAHLGYLIRYYTYSGNADLISFEDKTDVLTVIFRELMECGIALEINTSGCRQGLGDTIPPDYCLRLYRSLGGDSFTVGSDAHKRDHIGYGVREAYDKLEALGVDHVMIAEGGVLVPKKF